MTIRFAQFAIGDVVRHRLFPFRGVVYDVDPGYANTEAWYQAIPADIRPAKDQPFYHLLAEADDDSCVAYVCEANLMADDSGRPVAHPHAQVIFSGFQNGHYLLRSRIAN